MDLGSTYTIGANMKMGLLLLALVAPASALKLMDFRNDPVKKADLHGRPSKELPQKFKKMWEQEQSYVPSAKAVTPELIGDKDWSAHGKDVKLVVGIPMISSQKEVLDAHLSSWMMGEGVCHIDNHDDHNCHVFPVFLFGENSKASTVTKFALSLPIPEPAEVPDDGYSTGTGSKVATDIPLAVQFRKTHDWFKHAATSYKWATHIGKMDADTYPHFKQILEDLAAGPKDRFYWGSLMGHHNCHAGPNTGFMQGAFYIVSADLEACREAGADAMCPEGAKFGNVEEMCPALSFPTWQHEDHTFGDFLFSGLRSGKCGSKITCMDVKFGERYNHPV